ncbi:MAG: hypothetical protein COA58_08320 [Bacteroidetes bacterium]|nr:MAG: hypothetical protein COA58_08320 [Bacteroidota bacterium]
MRLTLLHIILFSSLVGFCQDNKFIATSYTPGFLLAHRADIKNLAAHNFGLEVAFEKEVSNSSWGDFYNKPSIGYGLLYYNLGKEETGHAFGILTHVKLNLVTLGSSDIKFRMGAGLAYLTKKFDVYDNRRNQAIGSHFNGSMQFGLIAHTPIRDNLDYIDYGISISHYSNAAFKVPNLGYNIPSVTIRYGFNIGTSEGPKNVDSTVLNKFDWRATLFYAKKQRNFADPTDFYNFGIQLRGLKNVNKAKAWRFGLDYTLDKTYKFSEDKTVALDSISLIDKSEVAIAAGFQWSFGKTDVIAEMGVYIFKPAVLKNQLSQRMGIAYRFTDRLSGLGTLRFHRGVADFFEMGIGYTL